MVKNDKRCFQLETWFALSLRDITRRDGAAETVTALANEPSVGLNLVGAPMCRPVQSQSAWYDDSAGCWNTSG